LEIEISDFETSNATLNGDYVCQVVEIVNGGVPHSVEIYFTYLLLYLGRIIMQGSVATNQKYPMCKRIRPCMASYEGISVDRVANLYVKIVE
jgi:hypothetical protein